MLIKESKACLETFEPTKTQAPGNCDSGPSPHPVDPNDSIMVGNPKHGIYVSRASMKKMQTGQELCSQAISTPVQQRGSWDIQC